jgi:hypothetical protein
MAITPLNRCCARRSNKRKEKGRNQETRIFALRALANAGRRPAFGECAM